MRLLKLLSSTSCCLLLAQRGLMLLYKTLYVRNIKSIIFKHILIHPCNIV